jgi:hypothetical protein
MQTWAARAASIGAAGLAIPSFSKKRAEAMGPAFGGGASSGEKGTAVGEPGGAGGVVSARGVDCGSGSGEPGGNQEGSKRHKLRFGETACRESAPLRCTDGTLAFDVDR